MDLQELRQFLIESNKAGYAGGEEKKWIKETDGSTTIPFVKGKFNSHDNFFGGEPYGGRVVIFQDKKPFWIMVYYGWVDNNADTNPIYKILRNALMHMPDEAPFRGPKEYSEGEYIYKNTWNGYIDNYSGEEQIIQGNKIIYESHYMGGLVDQREGV